MENPRTATNLTNLFISISNIINTEAFKKYNFNLVNTGPPNLLNFAFKFSHGMGPWCQWWVLAFLSTAKLNS